MLIDLVSTPLFFRIPPWLTRRSRGFEQVLIILFGGSTKKRQQKAIDQALALLHEYKARKALLEPVQSQKRKQT